MIDIILVRSNAVIYDPRVDKIVQSLSKKYSILVLGWNREGAPKQNIDEYIVKLKLFNVKTSFWRPSLLRMLVRLGAYFSLFWIWIFVRLIIYRPNIIHACDLDTIFPCYLYKLLFRKKLVFDVFDRYAMVFVPKKFKRFYLMVNWLEENLAANSDVLMTVNEKLLKTFRRTRHGAIIMNCPQDRRVVVSSFRELRKFDEIILIYTGLIRNARSLESVAAAIHNMDGVQFILAGPIMDKELLRQLISIPNINYRGLLRPSDALDLEASSDVMIALYDLRDPQISFAIPNKVLESMMCGIPVISNVAQELIKEVDCGVVVEYGNVDQIRETIIKLRDDPELRKRLGNNGRKAFLEKYNWNAMEQKLYQIYEDLLGK
jgi:glycosyltransferase involved in cell wall biosynthesis